MKDDEMNRTEIKDDAETQRDAAAIEARAVLIARDNDHFRQACGGRATILKGRAVHTAGVEALGLEFVTKAYRETSRFDDFSEDNDPHGERDFGAFEIDGRKLFWKIDYYSDERCQWGSEDPNDPAQVFRVLTLMLAEEY